MIFRDRAENRRKIGIVVRFSVSPSGKWVQNRVFPLFPHVNCRKRAVSANFARIVSENVVFLRIFHPVVRKQRRARQAVPFSRVYHVFHLSCGGNGLRFVRRSSSPRVQEDLYTGMELRSQRSFFFLHNMSDTKAMFGQTCLVLGRFVPFVSSSLLPLPYVSIPRLVSPFHSSLLNSHFHLRLREARPGRRAGFARVNWRKCTGKFPSIACG